MMSGTFTFNLHSQGEGNASSSKPSKTSKGLPLLSCDSACNQIDNSNHSMPCEQDSRAWRQQEKKKGGKKNKIPRPPNDFMIFRSVLLQGLKDFVFYDDEGNQCQLNFNLKSAVAGVYWWRLSAVDRKPWIDAAIRVLQEHGAKYPGYVFKPKRAEKGAPKKSKHGKVLQDEGTSSATSSAPRSQKRRKPSSPPPLPSPGRSSNTYPITTHDIIAHNLPHTSTISTSPPFDTISSAFPNAQWELQDQSWGLSSFAQGHHQPGSLEEPVNMFFGQTFPVNLSTSYDQVFHQAADLRFVQPDAVFDNNNTFDMNVALGSYPPLSQLNSNWEENDHYNYPYEHYPCE